MNLRGEGSSDHNGLLLELLDSSDLPMVSLLREDLEAGVVIMNVDTGMSKVFKSVECPRISFEIGGISTQALLDSGAPFSIYNPPGLLDSTDPYLRSAIATGSRINCSFTGATGGSITAEQNYLMSFKIGGHSFQGNFVVLSSHERNLPLFLFGMDILMGPLQGVAVVPDLKDQLDKLSVYFGVDWSVGHPCEDVIRIKHPPIFQSNISLIEDIDDTLISGHLPLISRIDPHSLFDSAPLTEDAFIFGGSGDKEEHEVDDDVLYSEYCQSTQTDQGGFQDCPLPVVQVGVALQDSLLSPDIKVLIDSGATLNLISRSFVQELLTTHGHVVRQAIRDCSIADLL